MLYFNLGKANPGSMDWNKDYCTTVGFGGPKAGMDKRFVWIKPHDLGALDSRSEPGGNSSHKTKASTGPADSVNACYATTIGTAPGKDSSGVWAEQGCLGRTSAGDTLKREFWGKAESQTSPEVAA